MAAVWVQGTCMSAGYLHECRVNSGVGLYGCAYMC